MTTTRATEWTTVLLQRIGTLRSPDHGVREESGTDDVTEKWSFDSFRYVFSWVDPVDIRFTEGEKDNTLSSGGRRTTITSYGEERTLRNRVSQTLQVLRHRRGLSNLVNDAGTHLY